MPHNSRRTQPQPDPETRPGEKKKIAILGTGVGAMAAAFELTSAPGWQERYEITVYQQGWRMGGKGASGRNWKHSDRNEEHGLHLWVGIYENAFRVMRRCYEELGRNPNMPLATVWDAFKPFNFAGVMENVSSPKAQQQEEVEWNDWVDWIARFKENSQRPGEGRQGTSIVDLFERLVELAVNVFRTSPFGQPEAAPRQEPLNKIPHLSAQLTGDGAPLIDTAPAPPSRRTRGVAQSLLTDAAQTLGFIDDVLPATLSGVLGFDELVGAGKAAHQKHVYLHLLRTLELARKMPRLDGGIRAGLEVGASILESTPLTGTAKVVVSFMEAARQWLKLMLGEELDKHTVFRRLWIIFDLITTVLKGIVEDGILWEGWDAIDEYDLIEWLKQHGASEITRESGIIRGMYEFVFAYERGQYDDPKARNLAAGSILRFMTRMFFDYRGAVFYTMQAGMGDTVFAPLYLVLKRRGVKFKFFHKVTGLRLDKAKKSIQWIDINRQVKIKSEKERQLAHLEWLRKREADERQPWQGAQATAPVQDPAAFAVEGVPAEEGEYDPLFDVKGLACWPSEPFYHQLVRGKELEAGWEDYNLESWWSTWPGEDLTLEKGKDFDWVVLGISLGALPYLCPELLAASKEWRDMVKHLGTVQTQAMQLWTRPGLENLGWGGSAAVVDAYEQPMNTYCDLSHLINRENWRPGHEYPGSLGYFCGPMKDLENLVEVYKDRDKYKGVPKRAREEVGRLCKDWLKQWPRRWWPDGTGTNNPDEFNWYLLVDLKQGRGEERFSSQYWRANIDPSERYVLSLKGTLKYRLHPGHSHFDNLFLAGDWTLNGYNTGCVEAATMSGMMAARAISGYPRVIVNERDGTGARAAMNKVDVSGHYESNLLLMHLPIEQVSRMLPARLRLAARKEAKAVHPVLLIFSKRTNVRFGFPMTLLDTDYDEVMLAVPSVEHPAGSVGGRRGPFLFFPQVWLTDRRVVAGSGLLWGFGSCNARIKTPRLGPVAGRGSWSVTMEREQHPLFTLSMSADSPFDLPRLGRSNQGSGGRARGPGGADDFLDNLPSARAFEQVAGMLNQPILLRTKLGLYNVAKLDWSTELCSIRPMDALLRVHKNARACVPKGDYEFSDADRGQEYSPDRPRASEAQGAAAPLEQGHFAFQMSGEWRLSLPTPLLASGLLRWMA